MAKVGETLQKSAPRSTTLLIVLRARWTPSVGTPNLAASSGGEIGVSETIDALLCDMLAWLARDTALR